MSEAVPNEVSFTHVVLEGTRTKLAGCRGKC